MPWNTGKITSGVSPVPLTNLVLWLKADQISGLANGAAVSTWQDQSGHGNDVTQATAANQPAYTSTLAGLNNLPAVLFDGTTDYLTRANRLYSSSVNWTMFAAIKPNRAVTPGQVVVHNGDDGGGGGLMNVTNVNSMGGVLGSVAFMSDGAASTAAQLLCLENWGVDPLTGATNTRFYLRDVEQTLGNHTSVPAAPNNTTWVGAVNTTIGVDRFFDGYMGEILVYSASLVAADRAQVANYLIVKWGL